MDEEIMPAQKFYENQPWSDGQLGYLAGIIDGEGCIRIDRTKAGKTCKRPYIFFLLLTVSNTDSLLCQYLKQTYEGYTYPLYHNKYNEKHSTCWEWRITGYRAAALLKLVYPYLRVKKQQAEIAMEFQEKRKKPRGSYHKLGIHGGFPMSSEEYSRQAEDYLLLRSLKRGGRVL